MKRSTLVSVSRRALQLATLFAAAALVAFGGEPVTSDREHQLIGEMVVTADRLAPANVLVADLGGMTVTANRVTTFADIGAMTVTARRITSVVLNDAPKAGTTSL